MIPNSALQAMFAFAAERTRDERVYDNRPVARPIGRASTLADGGLCFPGNATRQLARSTTQNAPSMSKRTPIEEA